MSTRERLQVTEALAESPKEEELTGRIVRRGDVLLEVEALLGQETLDKAYVSGGTDQDIIGDLEGKPERPVEYVKESNGRVLFKRPDTTVTHLFVFPDDAPDFYHEATADAWQKISGAVSGDCLKGFLVDSLTESEYDDLHPLAKAMTYMVRVIVDSRRNACAVQCTPTRRCAPPGITGCATAPKLSNVLAGGFGQVRLQFGERLGLVEDQLDADNAETTILHEVGHLMGLDHPDFERPQSIWVPGTSDDPAFSMMLQGNEDAKVYSEDRNWM